MAKKPLGQLSFDELQARIKKAEPYSSEWEDLVVENDIRNQIVSKNPINKIIDAAIEKIEREQARRLRIN